LLIANCIAEDITVGVYATVADAERVLPFLAFTADATIHESLED
jgi:hypothetical protein